MTTAKGRIVPKAIRERLRIRAGDHRFVVNEQGDVVLRPAKADVTSLRAGFRG